MIFPDGSDLNKKDKMGTKREEGKRSFVRAKKRAHNGRLQAALRARKLRAVLGLRHISASRVRCAETSCSRKSLGAISLQRSELLKSMVRTVLIIVVVECFGSCFPSSWFEVFGKDRFSLSQLVSIIKVFYF